LIFFTFSSKHCITIFVKRFFQNNYGLQDQSRVLSLCLRAAVYQTNGINCCCFQAKTNVAIMWRSIPVKNKVCCLIVLAVHQ